MPDVGSDNAAAASPAKIGTASFVDAQRRQVEQAASLLPKSLEDRPAEAKEPSALRHGLREALSELSSSMANQTPALSGLAAAVSGEELRRLRAHCAMLKQKGERLSETIAAKEAKLQKMKEEKAKLLAAVDHLQMVELAAASAVAVGGTGGALQPQLSLSQMLDGALSKELVVARLQEVAAKLKELESAF